MKAFRKKLMSAVLAAAMLVGILPTSALAVHTNEGAGSEGLGSAQIFIDPSPANDEALTPASELPNYQLTLGPGVGDDIYPYTIQIQEGQTAADFYAEARVQMNSSVATTLASNDTLDVVKTRFLIFMAVSENIDVDTQTDWLFNSTFLTPDEDVLAPYGVEVRRATDGEYPSSYVSETGTAIDMGWVMSGDLSKLIIPNQVQTGAAATTGAFDFGKYFDDEGCYVDDGDGTLELGDRVNTAFGPVLGITEDNTYPYSHNMNIYAIPVKMNWEAVRNAIEDGSIKSNCQNPAAIDENSAAGGSLYADFTAADFMAPMELTALNTPDKGLKMTVDFTSLKPSYRAENSEEVGTRDNWFVDEQYLVDQFIPTTSDKDGYGTDWIHYVDAIPVSGVIGGAVYAYQSADAGESGLILGRYGTDAIDAGTILVQFTKPVTGDIKVEKTIKVQDGVTLTDDRIAALAGLDGTTLGITVTNADGNEVAEGNTLTLSWDETAQTLTASGKISGLASDSTYDVAVDAESTAALEEVGLYLQGGIEVSGGEDIDLTDYYQLTRNEDGTVNTSGLIDADKIPTVTVTSTYGTTKPVDPTVTLTYDPNGGDGEDYSDTYAVNADVTVKSASDVGFTREGYRFTGWNTQSNGSGTAYQPGASFQITQDTTLYAQWAEIVDWSGGEVGKTATNLDSNYESDVTLSLPAAGYQKEVDVVFAIDCSSVLENNTEEMAQALYQMAQELLQKENILLNIGVVGYGHNADVLADLQAVNAENADEFLAALTAEFENSLTDNSQIDHDGGSNVQVGIRTARELLDNSTTGSTANNRHLILMTDGAGFYYCRSDTDDTSVSTVHRGDIKQSMGNMDATTDVGGAVRMNDSMYIRLESEGKDFGDFIAEQGAAIEESAVNSFSKAEAADVSDEQSYTTAQVQKFDTYPYINMERGTYFAAQELLKAKDAGYQITTIGYPYQAGVLYSALEAVTAGFRDWTATIGDYYDGSQNIDTILSSISDEIGQYVDAGSKVVDEIGSGTDNHGNAYNFDFINDIERLTLTVGGTALNKTRVDATIYSFGTEEKPNQFTLHYYENGTTLYGKTYSECFVWDINVPVTIDAPVQLTYAVDLTNPQLETAGIYGQYDEDGLDAEGNPLTDEGRSLFTNNSATLFPVSSDNVATAPVSFPKPTVSYTAGAVKLEVQDITVYTGGEGADGVINDDTGDESEVEGGESNGLPTPGYTLVLPNDVNEKLAELIGQDEGAVSNGHVNLSDYLTFTYSDGTEIREWPLAVYEDGNYSGINSTLPDGRYVYRIEPAMVAGEAIPIRLEFHALDDNGDPIGDPIISDDFDANATNLYDKYSMTIYAGALEQDLVKANLTIGDDTYAFDVEIVSGTLTVRGVEDNSANHPVQDNHEAVSDNTNAVDRGTTVTAVDSNTADTTYYINEDESVTVDPDNVHLLADSTLENDTPLKDYLLEKDHADSGSEIQLLYLDLVDNSNGNAVVVPSQPLDIYWKIPNDANVNGDFRLVHFKGLDREYDGAELDEILDSEQLPSDETGGTSEALTFPVFTTVEDEHGVLDKVQIDGAWYLRFATQDFSPFALIYDRQNGGSNPGGGGNNKPDDLNTEDHFAYIIGYPKDYRTGEPTDDESLWPVEPQGDITRAEVATIFFRMLTDDARSENWSQTNSYTDVATTDWYNNAISTLSNMGIISGDPSGAFRPDDSITRAEFTKIAVGFFDKAGDYVDGTYDDVSSSDWYADFIDAAVDLGLIEGYPDGTIRPEATITRAEACTIVNRTLGRVPDKDHLLPADEMRVWPDNSDTNEWYYAQIQEATNSHDYEWIGEENDQIENWTEKLEDRDWAQLEREWSDANSAPGGEVVD